MEVVARIDRLRAALDGERAAGRSVGFVPTMGAFHEGHRSLMRAARAAHDVVVVSLFVNPLQFGPSEDLDRYPRDPEGDRRTAALEGVDFLFAPAVEEMYPHGLPLTTVRVRELSEGLCGTGRPVHFEGVATVVAKLFAIVGPCTAYFGKKDYQQYVIVKRLVEDLSLPVEVVACPVVREADGLAMSSRNAYLSPQQRRAAAVLFRALRGGVEAVEEGERDPAAVRRRVANTVTLEPAARLEYVEVVSAIDLRPLPVLDGEVLVAVAARVGPARLIDNVTLSVRDDHVEADLGVTVEVATRYEEEPCGAS